jgi:Holliday junction DNA helicase RuvA
VYRYLRGTYRGQPEPRSGIVILEAGGIGYEVLVPPTVEQEITSTCAEDDPLLLYVSAQSTRDLPWPVLFGFLQAEERAFWELLISVPRMGGKSAVRAMAAPVADIARAIQDGNKLYLDNLPGVTLEGAEKIVAALRKKVGPFVRATAAASRGDRRRPLSTDDEMREDAVELLAVMGVKRPDAQRAVDALLVERDERNIVSVQDVITEYFRTHQKGRE